MSIEPVPLAKRFVRYLSVGDQCWEWTGARNPDGYGIISVGVIDLRAHRVAWELFFGPIQDGLFVCHQCDNPPCVNPNHLFLGTNRENLQDAIRKGRINRKGDRANRRKLRSEDIVAIRLMLKSGISGADLARNFGVSRCAISDIKYRRSWSSVPDCVAVVEPETT